MLDRNAALKLFAANLTLARGLAKKIHQRLPRHVMRDDIEAAALVGLWEACQRYEPERAVSFKTYCWRRIHGAVMDWIRVADWLPRSARRDGVNTTCRPFSAFLVEDKEGRRKYFEPAFQTSEEAGELMELLSIRLSPRSRLAASLYFCEKLTMRQVGERLGVSESRVSQMFSETILPRMCIALRHHLED